jgi:hypothetical protein
MNRLASLACSLALAALLAAAPSALAQGASRAYSVVAFDKDCEKFLLRVDDPAIGLLFQVRLMFQGRMVEEATFDRKDEKEAEKKLRAKHKLTDDAVKGQKTPDGKYVLMGFKDGVFLRLFFLEQASMKAGYYDRVELKQAEDGNVGEAFLKEAFWTPDGRQFLAIVHQKLSSPRLDVDADQFYVYTFKRYKIHFSGDQGDGEGEQE